MYKEGQAGRAGRTGGPARTFSSTQSAMPMRIPPRERATVSDPRVLPGPLGPILDALFAVAGFKEVAIFIVKPLGPEGLSGCAKALAECTGTVPKKVASWVRSRKKLNGLPLNSQDLS